MCFAVFIFRFNIINSGNGFFALQKHFYFVYGSFELENIVSESSPTVKIKVLNLPA